VVDVGRKDLGESDAENCIYDLYEYYDDMISKYPQKYRKEMSYNPQSITHQIENKVIRGVECKIGLYINDNPIVERLFYVDGFNPISRWSVDLTNTFMEILDTIIDKIKNAYQGNYKIKAESFLPKNKTWIQPKKNLLLCLNKLWR